MKVSLKKIILCQQRCIKETRDYFKNFIKTGSMLDKENYSVPFMTPRQSLTLLREGGTHQLPLKRPQKTPTRNVKEAHCDELSSLRHVRHDANRTTNILIVLDQGYPTFSTHPQGSQPLFDLVNKAAHVKITIGDVTNSLNYCVAFYNIRNLNTWLQGGLCVLY